MFTITEDYDDAVDYIVESILPLPSGNATEFLKVLHPVADLLAFVYNKEVESVEERLIEAAKEYDIDYDRSLDE
jgi:hypothetical protein